MGPPGQRAPGPGSPGTIVNTALGVGEHFAGVLERLGNSSRDDTFEMKITLKQLPLGVELSAWADFSRRQDECRRGAGAVGGLAGCRMSGGGGALGCQLVAL